MAGATVTVRRASEMGARPPAVRLWLWGWAVMVGGVAEPTYTNSAASALTNAVSTASLPSSTYPPVPEANGRFVPTWNQPPWLPIGLYWFCRLLTLLPA